MADPTNTNQKKSLTGVEKIILGCMITINTMVMIIAITMVESILIITLAAMLLFLVPIGLVFIIQKFPNLSGNINALSSSLDQMHSNTSSFSSINENMHEFKHDDSTFHTETPNIATSSTYIHSSASIYNHD